MIDDSDRQRWRPHIDRRLALWVLVPYLALVGFHLYLALPLTAPTVVDELGYLGNARFLATGEGLVDPAGRSAYKLGYSFFLVPAFVLGQDPELGFRWALGINSLLMPLAYPALFVFLGQIRPAMTPGQRATAALALNLHPAPMLYAASAMSASAFIPLYCWLGVAFFAAIERSRWWHWAILHWAMVGAVAASLYAVHERALGIALLIGGAALAYPLLRRRLPAAAALVAFPAGALVLGAMRALSPRGAIYPGDQSFEILQRVLDEPEVLLAKIAGHGIYLTLSSLGLVLLALTVGSVVWLGKRRLLDGSGLFWWVWTATGLSIFAVSVLFLASLERTDPTYLIYGRYNEGVVLPFMAIALALLHGVSGSRGRWRTTTIAAGVAVGLAWAALSILSVARQELFTQVHYHFHTLATFALRTLGLWSLQDLLWLLGGVAVFVPLALAGRWLVSVLALALVFGAATLYIYEGFWTPFSAKKARQHVLADVVRQLPDPPRRLLYDRRTFPNFHYYNYSYFLPQHHLVRVDLERLERPEDDLVISSRRDLATLVPGARLVAMENIPLGYGPYVQYLWVFPGDLQARLGEAGWLFPVEFPDTVLCRRPRSELEVLDDEPADGIWRRETVRLRITNRGPCPWPNAASLRSGPGSVRLGILWYRTDGTTAPVAKAQVDLPRTLLPGQSVDVQAPLIPPSLRSAVRRPEPWSVEIGLLQEQKAWFRSWGDRVSRLVVEG